MKLTPTHDGYVVRLRFGKGRGRFTIRLRDEQRAQKRAVQLQDLASKLANAGKYGEARIALEKGAAVATEREFGEVQTFVDELCVRSSETTKPRIVTFEMLANDWVSGKLHEQWPDYIRLKKDVANDKSRLAKLYRIVGDVPIHEFTLADAERAIASLPKNRTTRTRRHYAQLMTKVLRLAVYPLRLIDRNPLPNGFLPTAKSSIVFGYIYPVEEARLLACAEIPHQRRLLYGVLAREGLRLGEALSLRWRDLDLERGVVTLDENKTGEPRSWVLAPGVAEALSRFRPEGLPSEAVVFAGINKEKAAELFREHLHVAGIDRAQLFERSKNRRPIRVHDLRATFVTLSLAAGRTETWVMDRTGHKSSDMINRYRRQARQAAELNLGELLPLNVALRLEECEVDRPAGAARIVARTLPD